MRKGGWILGAALALALCLPVRAQLAAGRAEDLSAATDEFRDAVRNNNLTAEDISGRTFAFSNQGLPSTAVGLRFHKYNWHEFAAPDAHKAGSVQSIMEAGSSSLNRTIKVPAPEVGDAANRATDMFNDGRLNFGQLADNEAGEYKYQKGSSELGRIELTDYMKIMARMVAEDLLYATVIHEARHANDQQKGQLSNEEVKAGEIAAFHSEYEYIAAITHNGEEIATSWLKLNALYERTHLAVVKRASDYVFSLIALYRTHGEEDRLKEYVEKMGYQEGQEAPKPGPSPISS